MNVEKVSAITVKVKNMARSGRFYNEILRLEIIYGAQIPPSPRCVR
jgi:hypothetical protein